MTWYVGIDEAGYGPNLGPMVQAAVAINIPDSANTTAAALAPWIRLAHEKDKKRIAVDDSKKVNTGKHGFAKLEAGLTAFLGLRPTVTLGDWLTEHAAPGCVDQLADEAWYMPTAELPVCEAMPADHRTTLADHGITLLLLGVNIVPTPLFNQIIAGSGTKGTVTAIGVTSLLTAIRTRIPGFDPIVVVCDKLGGRNQYANIVQAAFPEGWVTTLEESAAQSRYRVESLGRDLTVTFCPRADGDNPETALASMTAKYLRELFMRQFNAWWQQRVPDLKPTLGYPQDAKRFYAEIEPYLQELKLSKSAVWREK